MNLPSLKLGAANAILIGLVLTPRTNATNFSGGDAGYNPTQYYSEWGTSDGLKTAWTYVDYESGTAQDVYAEDDFSYTRNAPDRYYDSSGPSVTTGLDLGHLWDSGTYYYGSSSIYSVAGTTFSLQGYAEVGH